MLNFAVDVTESEAAPYNNEYTENSLVIRKHSEEQTT